MKFSKVSLAYGERTILKNIDVSLERWDFVFIIGSSGSGKTSFIRGMIGAFPPKSGKILDSQDRDIYKLHSQDLLSYRRNIGVIFQDFKLLPLKTVRENVAFAMEVCWYDNSTILKRVPEVLAQVWLLTKKDKFIESLSGGELQRTAIARALIHNPDIIIGDEPTGNLDPKNAEEIISLLEKLHQQGKTIVISTHDDRLVNSMKKRVITFANGGVFSDIQAWTYNV
jgi:cell division transport system ATP-binding protein